MFHLQTIVLRIRYILSDYFPESDLYRYHWTEHWLPCDRVYHKNTSRPLPDTFLIRASLLVYYLLYNSILTVSNRLYYKNVWLYFRYPDLIYKTVRFCTTLLRKPENPSGSVPETDSYHDRWKSLWPERILWPYRNTSRFLQPSWELPAMYGFRHCLNSNRYKVPASCFH